MKTVIFLLIATLAATPISHAADTTGVITSNGMSPKTNSAPAQTNSVASKTKMPDLVAKNMDVKRQLTGAELYSINCNRCHPERYPTERTGAQWKTIMLHMQVRANIPVSQAKLILQYLQENSGR